MTKNILLLQPVFQRVRRDLHGLSGIGGSEGRIDGKRRNHSGKLSRPRKVRFTGVLEKPAGGPGCPDFGIPDSEYQEKKKTGTPIPVFPPDLKGGYYFIDVCTGSAAVLSSSTGSISLP